MKIHRPLFTALALASSLPGSVSAGVGVGASPLPGAEVIIDGTRAMLDESGLLEAGFKIRDANQVKIVDDPVDKGTVLMTDDHAEDGGKFGAADIVTKKPYRDSDCTSNSGSPSRAATAACTANRYEIQVPTATRPGTAWAR